MGICRECLGIVRFRDGQSSKMLQISKKYLKENNENCLDHTFCKSRESEKNIISLVHSHFVCFQILRKKIDYFTGYNVAGNCRRVRCIWLWLFVFCLFRFGAVGSGRKNMFSQATEPFNSRKPLYVYYTLATFIDDISMRYENN